MSGASHLRLGLIGDNIGQSSAPLLHLQAGAQKGIPVTYDRLVPPLLGKSFDQVFDRCQTTGYHGLNITYPYKERVMDRLRVDDPLVRAMGAANTVVFGPDGPLGYNTDYTGFVAAYRRMRKDAETGPVLMIGAGGVGRAVAFGLAALGTQELRLVDTDMSKAAALATALADVAPAMQMSLWSYAEKAAQGASGLINCTPLGMVGYHGTPLQREAMVGAGWAFDAVYTPVKTQFLAAAAVEGLEVIPGWELFFYQGVHSWKFFSGLPLDEAKLRHDLLSKPK